MRGLYFWQMFYTQTYKSNWWGFIGKRLLVTVIAFFVISFLIFFTIQVNLPPPLLLSDPPGTMSKEEVVRSIQESCEYTGLIFLYFRWVGDFFTGDWGYSIIYNTPVKGMIF